jgi:hypothetical protein
MIPSIPKMYQHIEVCLLVHRFYLFLAVYSMGVDVAGVVFYSELFPNHIRAKGVCLSMATVALTDLVYLQATTTAFANIGWRFYLVFIIICGVGVVGAYFVSSFVLCMYHIYTSF